MPANPSDTIYIGRFAPSPTGPLHFGSLVSALASYLDARKSGGNWMVRMEDIDPPRQPPGADSLILKQLEKHGLLWDGPVLFQSSRTDAYRAVIKTLLDRGLIYPCTCSREQLKARGKIHHGPCRPDKPLPREPYAWRLRVANGDIGFNDLIRGEQTQNPGERVGDFVLQRKDGLFAYQLAVVADEEFQGITHIIRGGDLLESTFRQIYLQGILGYRTPRYGHIPLAVDAQGAKLSKQNFAPSLDSGLPRENLSNALGWLGFVLPGELEGADCRELLDWATGQWQRNALAALKPEITYRP